MTIQALYPLTQPSLNLDFANTKKLDPRITFTRASTATYYDGKKVTKAEENLFIQSEEITTSAYVGSGVSRTGNTDVAPNGTTTADTLLASGVSGAHLIQQAYTTVASTTYAFSWFIKAGTNNFVQLCLSTEGRFANFDLSTGVVGSTGGIISAGIEPSTNGFYRCSMIFTVSSAVAQNFRAVVVSSNTAVQNENNTLTTSVILWGAQLEQRSFVTAYTATTTQPITNYIPTLLTAPAGVPRLQHNPVTGASRGMLVEGARTNLLLRSEEFADASWTKNESSIQANTVIAPDGTLTADKLVENTALGYHTVFRASSLTSGTAYAVSVYAKAGERRYFTISAGSIITFPARVTFDLQTGTVAGTEAGVGSIRAVGNGWYRCSVVGTAGATASTGVNFATTNTTSYAQYTGDGYSGIYIWGAQLEAGVNASSYIKTEAAQVTRSTESPDMLGANFSSWYNRAQGTLVVEYEYDLPTTIANGCVVSINNAIGTQHMVLVATGLSTDRFLSLPTEFNTGFTSTTSAQILARAFSYSATSARSTSNTGASASVTPFTPPISDRLSIGFAGYFADSRMFGTVRRIAYYPIQLTQTEQQSITG